MDPIDVFSTIAKGLCLLWALFVASAVSDVITRKRRGP